MLKDRIYRIHQIIIISLLIVLISSNVFARVSCNFSVYGGGSGPNSLNGWKFWTNMDEGFYDVNLDISAASGAYAVLFVEPSGKTQDVMTNQSQQAVSFVFAPINTLTAGI